MPSTGNSRAEASQITSVGATDLIKIQQLQSAYPSAGQYHEKEITYENLLFAQNGESISSQNAVGGYMSIQAGANGISGATIYSNTNTVPVSNAAIQYFIPIVANTTSTVLGAIPSQFCPVINGGRTGFWMYHSTQHIAPITAQAGARTILLTPPFDGALNQIVVSVDGTFTTSNIVVTGYLTHAGVTSAITSAVVTVPFSGSVLGTNARITLNARPAFAAFDTISVTITGGVGAVNGLIGLQYVRTSI